MKKSLLTILMLFCISFSFAQFRNTTWGMSKKQVRDIEDSKFSGESTNFLDYSLDVEDLKCRLQYFFNDKDKLISINYTFSNTNSMDNQSNLFNRTCINIIDKYGEPSVRKDNYLGWNSKGFSINAFKDSYKNVIVIYSPPAPSQKDIL